MAYIGGMGGGIVYGVSPRSFRCEGVHEGVKLAQVMDSFCKIRVITM